MVSPINCSIPKDVQRPLTFRDNLSTHATNSFKAFGHDLLGFTIGCSFFPRSNSVVESNGKGKGGKKVNTSLMECVISDPSKEGREMVLQGNVGIKTSTNQKKKDKGKISKLPCRGLNHVESHEFKGGVFNPYF